MTIKATGTTGTDLFMGEPGRPMHRLPDGADGLPGPASTEGNEAQVDFFGGIPSSAAEDRYYVAGLMGTVPGHRRRCVRLVRPVPLLHRVPARLSRRRRP